MRFPIKKQEGQYWLIVQKKLEALKSKTNLLNSLSNLDISILYNLDDEIINNYYKGGMLVKNAASVNPSLLY